MRWWGLALHLWNKRFRPFVEDSDIFYKSYKDDLYQTLRLSALEAESATTTDIKRASSIIQKEIYYLLRSCGYRRPKGQPDYIKHTRDKTDEVIDYYNIKNNL